MCTGGFPTSMALPVSASPGNFIGPTGSRAPERRDRIDRAPIDSLADAPLRREFCELPLGLHMEHGRRKFGWFRRIRCMARPRRFGEQLHFPRRLRITLAGGVERLVQI